MSRAPEIVTQALAEHQAAVSATFSTYAKVWEEVAQMAASALESGHTLLFCGNGGSACDAMHIAGEFVGRFVKDRRALPALALSADGGILTAIGNDYGFDQVFARQVEAYGRKGAILFALTTSGQSPNVLKAIEAANGIGMHTVLMTGERGMHSPAFATARIVVPSANTARVQEVHMLLLHLLASLVEDRLGIAA